MKNKKLWSIALIVTMFVTMALLGCSGEKKDGAKSTSPAPAPSPSQKVNVSIGSGTSGGAFYMVGAALAQTIQKYETNILANSEATGGTSENIRLVANKNTTIGMGMADDIVVAYNGERDYKNKPANNLRMLMSGQANIFHVITLEKSPINKLSDLRGKKISLGPSGAPYFGPNMLEAVLGFKRDTDYKGQYLGHDQAAEALVNGDIDAIIATVAYPSAAYSNIAMTHKLRFLEFSDEDVKKATGAYPFWQVTKIPQGTYGLTKDIQVPAIPVWLFTNKDESEDTIYRVVKSILEHSEELGKIHPDAGKYKIDTAYQGITLPFHPGAIKYYKEKGKM